MRFSAKVLVNAAALLVLAGVTSGNALATCPASDAQVSAKFFSSTWGTTFDGQRYQSSANTRINQSNVGQLKLRWAFGLASNSPRTYPLVSGDTIYVGDTGRGLLALDKVTGCVRWENNEFADIATAVVPGVIDGRAALFFTGRQSGVHAVWASNGESVWSATVATEVLPLYSGSIIVAGGRVFVPLSSMEIGLTLNPLYGCCTTSGGMAALDSSTGDLLWYLPTVTEEPKQTGRRWLFIEEYGPSGAPVWGAPMLDQSRGLLFYGSGQNYSRPATATSDAIFAVDVATGKPRWIKQFTTGDAYNIACEVSKDHPNCPTPMGPDVDFGAPPILVSTASGDLLLAGQKSGDVYALNPDTGEVVWATEIGKGGPLGGVHWGMAVDPVSQTLFVPISDRGARYKDAEIEPGMYAFNYADGTSKWSVARVTDCQGCSAGLSAAIASGPGFVMAGGLDGRLEAYASTDGALLWSYNSIQDYDAVNGVATRGGGFDAHGPMIADDLVIAISGYESFSQIGGNALLVFALPEQGHE